MRCLAVWAAVAGSLALLAACGSSGGSAGKLSCPSALTAPNLDSYTVFRPGGGTAPEDIQFGVKLVGVRSTCSAERAGLRVDTAISFIVARNDPQLRLGDFTYFVAIADAQQTVVAKQNFGLRADFAPRQNQIRVTDTITEHLPLRDLSIGRTYAVIVGLQLSQQQLNLNRQHQPTQ
jgi:hypothetical protein